MFDYGTSLVEGLGGRTLEVYEEQLAPFIQKDDAPAKKRKVSLTDLRYL